MESKETQIEKSESLGSVRSLQAVVNEFYEQQEEGAVVWRGKLPGSLWKAHHGYGYWLTVSCDIYEDDIFLGSAHFRAFDCLHALLLNPLQELLIPF